VPGRLGALPLLFHVYYLLTILDSMQQRQEAGSQ